MSKYSEFYDNVNFDGLVTDTKEQIIEYVPLKKRGKDETLKRGTILALIIGETDDGKYIVLGEEAGEGTADANCILAEDTEIKTADENVMVPVYKAGVFDKNKCTVASSYTIKETDIHHLEMVGIRFKSAMA